MGGRWGGSPLSCRLPGPERGAAKRARSSSQILFFTQLIPELFRDPISCQFILSCHSGWRPAKKLGDILVPDASEFPFWVAVSGPFESLGPRLRPRG